MERTHLHTFDHIFVYQSTAFFVQFSSQSGKLVHFRTFIGLNSLNLGPAKRDACAGRNIQISSLSSSLSRERRIGNLEGVLLSFGEVGSAERPLNRATARVAYINNTHSHDPIGLPTSMCI